MIRAHYAKEDTEKLLFDKNQKVLKFDVHTDPNLLILKNALNQSMMVCSSKRNILKNRSKE